MKRYILTRFRFAIRIWALYFRYKIFPGGKSAKKLSETYMKYFNFLENTADPSTEEGQKQIWRARVLRTELEFEGKDFWDKA